MVKDGRIFLFVKYPNQLPLGVLIAELDSEALYQLAVADLDSLVSYRINVFEQNRLSLFGNQISYPSDILRQQLDTGFYSIEQSGVTLYVYVSDKTGFTFLTVANNADIIPSFWSIMQPSFPFFAVFVVIIILFALYLIHTTYKPIQDVIYSMVTDGKQGWNTKGNEVDFIRDTYRDSEKTIGRLSGILSAVAPAVVERVFSSLLAEGGTQGGEAAMMLQSIGSDFLPDSKYIVLVMVQVDADFREVEYEINVAWFSNLLHHFWEGKAPCHFLRMDGGICVGILCFPEDAANAMVKQMVGRFQEVVKARSEEQGCCWLTGTGQLHVGIMELRKSYLEAREDLNRMLYYRQEQSHPEGELDADLQISLSYYLGRMLQMIGFALDDHEEDVRAGLSILHEVAYQYSQSDQARRIYQNLYNALVEEMIKYHIDPADANFSLGLQDKDTAEMEAAMLVFCQSAFAQLQAAGKRGHNKYAENTKKYIADHYFLSSLSLDQVSQHVGISSPYLSKIFAESTGAGFLDYLNQYRIDKAKQLLSATDLTVSEIGYKVGFQSPQSFARVFKRHMERSPSGYRETNRPQQKRM